MPQKRKRTYKSKSKKNNPSYSYRVLIVGALGVVSLMMIWHYRLAIGYVIEHFTDTPTQGEKKELWQEARVHQILETYPEFVVGMDVSQYQGKVNWRELGMVEDRYPIHFVVIRATMGDRSSDSRFKENWESVKELGLIAGAYHFYRPDENSILQAKNFCKNVELKSGDLPPILDIETLPKNQSMDSLKLGLKKWLDYVEDYYGVRPIIYSGEHYYNKFLREEFKKYKCWIARYTLATDAFKSHWTMWQFTEKGFLRGVNGPVDLNLYNGTYNMLRYETIR